MPQPWWVQALWVGLGGFAGSAMRFSVGYGLLRRFPEAAFPWGTLTVNVVGSLAIGYLAGVEVPETAEGLGAFLEKRKPNF